MWQSLPVIRSTMKECRIRSSTTAMPLERAVHGLSSGEGGQCPIWPLAFLWNILKFHISHLTVIIVIFRLPD